MKSALDVGELARVRRELTINLEENNKEPGVRPRIIILYLESVNKLYLPGAYGRRLFGEPDEDARKSLSRDMQTNVVFRGTLRDHQTRAVQAFSEASNRGILSVPCGGGKTVIAMKIVADLSTKTLIVLHKDFLIAQWRERISVFLPTVSVGLIKAAKVDVDDKDIVLASIQSLSSKDYGEGFFDSFGLLIVDEVHRSGTEVFFRALQKAAGVPATLGLSATLRRKDGMERIFKHYIGEIVYEIDRAALTPATSGVVKSSVAQVGGFGDLSCHLIDDGGDDEGEDKLISISTQSMQHEGVAIKMVQFYDDDPRYSSVVNIEKNDTINLSRMINNLCEFEPRITFAANLIARAFEKDRKRHALVLCDRKQLLRDLAPLLVLRSLTCGYYIGGMKPHELKASENADVILATFSFASEGFDLETLDTLFLLSPKTDIEQAIGRVLRKVPLPGQRGPEVYDLVDNFSVFISQARKRRAFYQAQGYRVYTERFQQ